MSTELAAIDTADIAAALTARDQTEGSLRKVYDLSLEELTTRLSDPVERAAFTNNTLLRIVQVTGDFLTRQEELRPPPVIHQTNNVLALVRERGLPRDRMEALQKAAEQQATLMLADAQQALIELGEQP